MEQAQHRLCDRTGYGPAQLDGFLHQYPVERKIRDGLRRRQRRPADRRAPAERGSGDFPRLGRGQGDPLRRYRRARDQEPYRHRRARHEAEGRRQGRQPRRAASAGARHGDPRGIPARRGVEEQRHRPHARPGYRGGDGGERGVHLDPYRQRLRQDLLGLRIPHHRARRPGHHEYRRAQQCQP